MALTIEIGLSSFDAWLLGFIESSSLAPGLREPITYAIFPSGKRIRPLLIFSCIADLGGDPQFHFGLAGCIELLHCASLAHDDLPALDNDTMRRGKPSLHCAFGEAVAILAGDSMIALAFAALAQELKERSEPPARIGAALLAATSRAFAQLCEGQVMDLRGAQSDEQLDQLERAKTGALFRALFQCAASTADLDPEHTELFGQFGEDLGLYFQVLDDFLDIFGNDAQRGRVGSSDSRNSKRTRFTSAHVAHGQSHTTIEESKEILQRMNLQIQAKLKQLEEVAVPLPNVRRVVEQISQRWQTL